jgi:hypothetical protein
MKTFYLAFIISIVSALNLYSSDADLFNLDYEQVKNEFNDLDQIANIIENNPDYDFYSFSNTYHQLVMDTNLKPESSIMTNQGNPFLGIPSFLWGCVTGPLGILIAFVGTENDHSEAKKALWGCITQQVLVWGCYFGSIYFLEFSFYTGG